MSSSEPSSSSQAKERSIKSSLGDEVSEILSALLDHSKKTPGLGDDPKAGYGFIENVLRQAGQEQSIHEVIERLINIKGGVDARAGGFFRSDDARIARTNFSGMIENKITLLKQLAQKKAEEEKQVVDATIENLSSEKEKAKKEAEALKIQLGEEKEEKIQLKSGSDYWHKLKDGLAQKALSLETEEGGASESSALALRAIASLDDESVLKFALMLAQKSAIQAQEKKQSKSVFEKVPLPRVYAGKKPAGAGEIIYDLDDMQSMLVYRKPILVFNVIRGLLNELGELGEKIKSMEAKSKEPSSISSSSRSTFMFSSQSQNRLKIKMHNMQVILCYFFLYNAPMHFLIEEAMKQAQEFTRENQASFKNSWNVLGMVLGEIPGLEKVGEVIEQESARLSLQDTYEYYRDFIQARVDELLAEKAKGLKNPDILLFDRDGTPLFEKYGETFHTFIWHQLCGLYKLFQSQNIADVFGDSELARVFDDELFKRLGQYQKAVRRDPNQPIMDVEMQNGELQWANGKMPASVSLKP